MLAFLLVFQVTSVSAASEPINEVRDLIREYYVEDVPASILAKPTIKEITKHLDQYTVYMTAEEFEAYSNAIDQQLVGIGVVLEEDELGVEILSVIENGPAAKSGIEAGDIIMQVNGKSIAGQSVQQAISVISGKQNTSVTLTLYRPASKQSITKTLNREIIQLPNVEYEMLGGNIGFVRLNSFSLNAAKDVASAIKKLNGAEGWIFDLRNNGGGYVSAAQEVAGLFPNVTRAFQLRYKSGVPEVYAVINQDVKFKTPTHILVNSYSASASEMVAAAVKEQKGATLYGQTTYGKGTMQSLLTLSDNSMLKLTTARFYSPKGAAVNEVGVAPNVVTEDGEELINSHKDQLINKFASYSKLPTLKDVPVTKVFNVKMNMDMNWTGVSAKDVQLIQLGGDEVPVEVAVVDNTNLKVTPKEKLQSRAHYLLVVHPNWKSKSAKSMAKGIYLEVTVK